MVTGVVESWDQEKKYGFVLSADSERVFVHANDLKNGVIELKKGQQVQFELEKSPKGFKAISVELLPLEKDLESNKSESIEKITAVVPRQIEIVKSEVKKTELDPNKEIDEIESLDTTNVDKKLLLEISKWKREAKAEDNDRYFWHVNEVELIKNGDKYFVIGRKGSGKTAICEYFNQISEHNVFAEKLSFKNFPFNELYGKTNNSFTPPNQFITIWKYLIYSTICRLMLKNEDIDPIVREQLAKLYGSDVSLQRRIGQWTGQEFGVSLFGFSVKVSKNKDDLKQQNWMEHVDFLEDIIKEYAGKSTYYVLFDELDEDYRDVVTSQQQGEQYKDLLTSLFKAAQDIRTTFGGRQQNTKIFPVVFLRDDIYDYIKDSDKTKWDHFKVDLSWNKEKIQKLMAFRISRAIDISGKKNLIFHEAWRRVFGANLIRVGSMRQNRISTFDFIAGSTFLRPRDFVSYLQSCAQTAIDNDTKITPTVVRKVDKAFSYYLKSELVDELFPLLPDISGIFDTLSQIHQWKFSVKEFEKAYTRQVEDGFIKDANFKSVARQLYSFSVIGNSPHGNSTFKYQVRDSNINFNEILVIHRGLFKALQIG